VGRRRTGFFDRPGLVRPIDNPGARSLAGSDERFGAEQVIRADDCRTPDTEQTREFPLRGKPGADREVIRFDRVPQRGGQRAVVSVV
jgi:hypothetical protein